MLKPCKTQGFFYNLAELETVGAALSRLAPVAFLISYYNQSSLETTHG